jgi:hypothetical protein
MPIHPAIPMAAIIILGIIAAKQSEKDPNWYDIYHTYHIISIQYTELIDDLLITAFNTGKAKIKSLLYENNQQLPGLGSHYLYLNHNPGFFEKWHKYLGIYKEEIENNNIKYYRYQIFIPPTVQGTLQTLFLSELINHQITNVRSVHIDTSTPNVRTVIRNLPYNPPRPYQEQLLDAIFPKYTNCNRFNVRLMVSGPRGSGKTFMGRLIKYKLDHDYHVNSQFFSNFDPSQIGVDIATLALTKATRYTPVVLIVNEIDIIFDKVIAQEQDFDPRTKHSRTKTTFHNMLDMISDTRFVFTIFTTEKPLDELYNNNNFKSFMRKGRIDLFYNMTTSSLQEVTLY